MEIKLGDPSTHPLRSFTVSCEHKVDERGESPRLNKFSSHNFIYYLFKLLNFLFAQLFLLYDKRKK